MTTSEGVTSRMRVDAAAAGGARAALESLIESLDDGDMPTFTVASWVTDPAKSMYGTESRLTPVRAIRVDVLRVALVRGVEMLNQAVQPR